MRSLIFACLAFFGTLAFAAQDCTEAAKQYSEQIMNLPVDHVVFVRTQDDQSTYKIYTQNPKWNFEVDFDLACNQTGDIRPF